MFLIIKKCDIFNIYQVIWSILNFSSNSAWMQSYLTNLRLIRLLKRNNCAENLNEISVDVVHLQ